LSAAVKEAHKRGLKITGHLCSITYEEAAEIGIDNLEHGFFVNTSLDPDKTPDTCTASSGDYTLEHMSPGSPEANRLIATLVKHHVAITSTLPNPASSVPDPRESMDGRPPLSPGALQAMAPSLREAVLYGRNRPVTKSTLDPAFMLRRDMDLERAFVAAGGLLIAGPDGNGIGGAIPGFGDHRQIELLVEAGFAPVEAIQIATLNGAIYLGREAQIGSIAAGKNADLLVVKGDPAIRIADIENVDFPFDRSVFNTAGSEYISNVMFCSRYVNNVFVRGDGVPEGSVSAFVFNINRDNTGGIKSEVIVFLILCVAIKSDGANDRD